MSSIKKQAIRGSFWSIVGYGGSQFLRLFSNLILTRLLVPELFGLMAIVNTFMVGLVMFSDIGLRPSIIRSERYKDPAFLNTAWTLQIFRGVLLWGMTFLICWPAAKFYDDPRLLFLIPMVGLSPAISGLNSTYLFVLERQLEVKTIAVMQLGSQLLSITIMVIWAYISPTVWALVVGNLASFTTQMIWSHRLYSEGRQKIFLEKNSVKEIFSFGKWIFFSTLMTFLASQVDKLILGKLLGLEFLGIFAIAFMLADVPQQLVRKLSSQIIYPLVSQFRAEGKLSLKKRVLKERKLFLAVTAILVALLASFGDFVVIFLYDRRYHQAAWILPLLSIGLWPMVLSLTVDKVLYAIGTPKYNAFGNFLKFFYIISLLPISFYSFGVVGAIVAISLKDLPFYLAVNYGLSRHNFSPLKQDIILTFFLIFLITLILFLRFHLELGFPVDLMRNP